jgi:probable F420-dependent oxidoreductase
VKFGLIAANTIPFADPIPALALAAGAEAAGFDSIWTVEHVVWPKAYESAYPYHPTGKMPGRPSIPIPDPLIWLTWVAGATKTLRLGTGVLILPQRNPVVLAKEVATLDHLSGGRVELGVGVGWLEEEFEALGVAWEGRGRRTDEFIAAMRELWKSDEARFEGEFIRFRNVASNPKPVSGTVPIVVGGHSPAAARRAAAIGDGFYPGPGTIDLLAKAIRTMREHAMAIGRDPDTIEVSAVYPGPLWDEPETAIATMRSLGVSRLMIPAYAVARPTLQDGLATFMADIAPLA